MFTGIIEAIGTVESLAPPSSTSNTTSSSQGTTLTLSTPPPSPILTDAHLGDSISINGTCLTITSFTPTSFTVGLSPETLRRTNLSLLSSGSKVNLERAVSATTRMGGHFVQGHVDGVAEIVERRADGEAVVFRLKPRPGADGEGEDNGEGMLRWVVEKGYVTLDGASLTVTKVDESEGWWEVMLVEYTQERVVMGGKGMGDSVNVEVDMVGKYVEKSVRGYFAELVRGGEKGEGGEGALERMVARLVDQRLKKVGR